MNRLESLDWLRGLLALSIMIYHLIRWKFIQLGSDELLGRLGIYGVSMFFILSGLAMAAGYANYIHDVRTAGRFFVRRVFRIWPLLWLAVASVTFGGVAFKGESVNWTVVLLNLTTVFGFVNPGAYINTGAWSIGNEMVYYALTPVLLGLYNRSMRIGNATVILTLAIAFYFAHWALTPAATLASQWQVYINPFNNLFLYAAGVAIYYNTRTLTLRPITAMFIMVGACALLVAYPSDGDLIVIVTGLDRLVYCLASVLIVLAFFKLSTRPPKIIAMPLAALGAATYGVYLLHPIIFSAVELISRRLGVQIGPASTIITTITLTIALSLLLYEKFELPLIRLGKRLTTDKHFRDTSTQPTAGRGKPTP